MRSGAGRGVGILIVNNKLNYIINKIVYYIIVFYSKKYPELTSGAVRYRELTVVFRIIRYYPG